MSRIVINLVHEFPVNEKQCSYCALHFAVFLVHISEETELGMYEATYCPKCGQALAPVYKGPKVRSSIPVHRAGRSPKQPVQFGAEAKLYICPFTQFDCSFKSEFGECFPHRRPFRPHALLRHGRERYVTLDEFCPDRVGGDEDMENAKPRKCRRETKQCFFMDDCGDCLHIADRFALIWDKGFSCVGNTETASNTQQLTPPWAKPCW